jgi:hypothetical protein
MKLIQLSSGYFGARQIAAARAEAALRKLGWLPRIKYRKSRAGRVWSDEEYDEAIVMRLSGMDNYQIAKTMKRTKKSVDHILGYGPPRVCTGGAVD